MPQPIQLQALILADHIYQDHVTGKYVIAGTFHQLNIAQFPSTFARSIGVFVSFRGVTGHNKLNLAVVDPLDDTVLIQTPTFEFDWTDENRPVELAVEVPPMPLPHAGQYSFRLLVNDTFVAETYIVARLPDNRG
jgi:hypothetical protein